MTQAQELKILFKELIELSPLEASRKEHWKNRLEDGIYGENILDELASEIGLALGEEEAKLNNELTKIEEQAQEIEDRFMEEFTEIVKEEKEKRHKSQNNMSLKILEEIRKKLRS